MMSYVTCKGLKICWKICDENVRSQRNANLEAKTSLPRGSTSRIKHFCVTLNDQMEQREFYCTASLQLAYDSSALLSRDALSAVKLLRADDT